METLSPEPFGPSTFYTTGTLNPKLSLHPLVLICWGFGSRGVQKPFLKTSALTPLSLRRQLVSTPLTLNLKPLNP